MAPARRSGRLKRPRAVCTEDPFESAGLSETSDSEKTRKASKGKERRRKHDDSPFDEEFVNASGEENGMDVDEAEDSFDDDDDDESAMKDVDESLANFSKTTVISHPRYLKKRRPDGAIAPAGDEVHSRGVLDAKDHVSKGMHFTLTFGTGQQDLLAAIYARDRWSRGIDSALPTRSSLDEAEKMSDYGCGATLGIDPEAVKRESTHGWDWYYDPDVGERFRKRQRIQTIKEAEARRIYLPRPKKGKHTILMGPADNQRRFSLGHHESLNLGEAWRKDQTGAKIREGWLLSLGQKASCTAWAPNQNHLIQYLAVAAPITDEQRREFTAPGSEPVSAFSPSQPYPTALQLWEFTGKETGSFTKLLDMDFKPRLRLVVCSEWGDLRRMSWCPVSQQKRAEDEKGASKSIGLLAGVWGDGKVRVLDIKIIRKDGATEFVKIQSPVFEARPPSTVCTCLTWLSPSDIAVGCSNGFVAVWSVLPSASEPLPYFYRPIHATYVLGIASAYPTHPELISTVSMDGDTRLWSIIDPQSETVTTPRMRIVSPHLSYSPIMQSFFSSDENEYARLMPMRRFFTTNSVARVSSTISALAPCSFWHPCVMYGGVGGEVVATNPLRRLCYVKEQQIQQTWFTHDWAPGPDSDSPGVSRFYDGYRAETQNLARSMVGEARIVNGITLTTIYDESTHVTALGWNPNPQCAAWASASLGCGLVRVEDLAV